MALRSIQMALRFGKMAQNVRQAAAARFLLEHGKMTIQDFENLFPGASRHSLQRDVKEVVAKGIATSSGATNRLEYRLA